MQGGIYAWGPDGKVVYELRPNQAGIAITPALSGNRLYVGEQNGRMYCYNLEPDKPELLWGTQFCACLGGDASCMAANDSFVVSPGMSEPPVEGQTILFSNYIYGLDAKSGKLQWSVKMGMPSLMVQPSIHQGAVVFMVSTGMLECVDLKDGKSRWKTPGRPGSMSTGGAIVANGVVFAASNQRSKKQPSAPFGGKGVVSAYDFKDGKQLWEQLFDLEANCAPALCPNGPGGKQAVVACLGATPHHPRSCPQGAEAGEYWDGRVVALDVKAGEVLWKKELPRWNSTSAAGNCTWMRGSNPNLFSVPPAGWQSPVVGANGKVYASWGVNGTLYVLEGATGAEVSQHAFGQPFASAPIISPGRLWYSLYGKGFGCFAQVHAQRGKVLKPLQVPLAESGTEHFWPNKHNDPRELGRSPFKCPHELKEPAWVFKTPLKLVDCWFGNSPIMDSQRNVYIGGNWSDLFVIRPDGTLRGSINVGPYPSTPAIYEDGLFVTNVNGYAHCYDLDTLELRWAVKYTDWTSSDNYALLAYEGSIFAPGNEFFSDTQHSAPYGAGRTFYESGHRIVYRLDCKTGATIWKVDFNPIMPVVPVVDVFWNITPVIFKEYMVFMDYNLGIYCVKWEDGAEVFRKPPLDAADPDAGRFSTGNQCAGANGLVYITGNRSHAFVGGKRNNVDGAGVVRAYDIATGERRFQSMTKDDRGDYMACNQGPLYLAAQDGTPALVAVPFSCNMGGNPSDQGSIKINGSVAGKLVAYDAETGEEVWARQWAERYKFSHVAGSFADDPGMTWPDSWGGLSADATGTIFVHWMDGMIYAINGSNGDIISSYQTGNSSNAQILLAPGMVVFTGGHGCFCFRDEAQEQEWLAAASAKGDPRAKVPLMDIPVAKEDVPARQGWEVWRGPIYAEEQTIREGEAWIELYTKIQCEANNNNEAWSKQAVSEAVAAPGWVVVGGGEKGIVVRSGKKLDSPELERLKKGARLEQLKRDGERLQFRKLSGEGPETGWVSLTFKGAPLVEPA